MDQKKTMYYREHGLGGFTEVAAYLSREFGIIPPLDRRRVYSWHVRHTVNRAGRPFPEPAYEFPAKRTQPKWIFKFEDVHAWYSAGVQAQFSNQYAARWE